MGSQRGGNPRQGMFAKKWIKMRNVIIKYANLCRVGRGRKLTKCEHDSAKREPN